MSDTHRLRSFSEFMPIAAASIPHGGLARREEPSKSLHRAVPDPVDPVDLEREVFATQMGGDFPLLGDVQQGRYGVRSTLYHIHGF